MFDWNKGPPPSLDAVAETIDKFKQEQQDVVQAIVTTRDIFDKLKSAIDELRPGEGVTAIHGIGLPVHVEDDEHKARARAFTMAADGKSVSLLIPTETADEIQELTIKASKMKDMLVQYDPFEPMGDIFDPGGTY